MSMNSNKQYKDYSQAYLNQRTQLTDESLSIQSYLKSVSQNRQMLKQELRQQMQKDLNQFNTSLLKDAKQKVQLNQISENIQQNSKYLTKQNTLNNSKLEDQSIFILKSMKSNIITQRQDYISQQEQIQIQQNRQENSKLSNDDISELNMKIRNQPSARGLKFSKLQIEPVKLSKYKNNKMLNNNNENEDSTYILSLQTNSRTNASNALNTSINPIRYNSLQSPNKISNLTNSVTRNSSNMHLNPNQSNFQGQTLNYNSNAIQDYQKFLLDSSLSMPEEYQDMYQNNNSYDMQKQKQNNIKTYSIQSLSISPNKSSNKKFKLPELNQYNNIQNYKNESLINIESVQKLDVNSMEQNSYLQMQNKNSQMINKNQKRNMNLSVVKQQSENNYKSQILGLNSERKRTKSTIQVNNKSQLNSSRVNKLNYIPNDQSKLQQNDTAQDNILVQDQIFITPNNVSCDQVLQSIMDKNYSKIPQNLRETYQKKKKQINEQRENKERIRQLELLVKQAQERNKKVQIANQLRKKELNYIKHQYSEYTQNPHKLQQILSSRDIVQKTDPIHTNFKSITNLQIPLNQQSSINMLNIYENSSQLINKSGITSINNLHNLTSNASLRSINMYEYVVVEDMLKELRSAKQRVILAQQNKDSVENLIEALREENNQLKKTVQRYQVLAREVNNKKNKSELKKIEINPMSRMSPTKAYQSPQVERFEIKPENFEDYKGYNQQNDNNSRNYTHVNNTQQTSFIISPNHYEFSHLKKYRLNIKNERSLSRNSEDNTNNVNTSFVRSLRQTFKETTAKNNSNHNVTKIRTRDPLSMIDVTQFEQLSYQIHFLVRDHQKFFDSILLFIEICKLTLNCDNCVVFVCDYQLEQVYINPQRKERGYLLKKAYIAGEPYTVILLSENETPDEYLAKVRQDFEDGILKDKGLLQGCFDSKGKLLFGVQVTKPKMIKESKKIGGKTANQNQTIFKTFNKTDQLKIRFLSEFLAKKAENIMLKWYAQEKEKKIMHILKCCNQIVKQRTHKGIIMTMRRELPSLFDFEKCCIFLFDPLNEDLFTVAEQDLNAKTSDSPSDAIIRFPTSLGLTGLACTDRILIYQNNLESDIRYNSDLDNLLAIHNLKNIIVSEFSAVESETQKEQDPVGVLQLLNKIGIDPISQFDVVSIFIQEILTNIQQNSFINDLEFSQQNLQIGNGTCVDNITILNYSVKVTLNVGQELNGVSTLINDREEKSLDSKMNFEIFMKNVVAIKRFLELLQKHHIKPGK